MSRLRAPAACALLLFVAGSVGCVKLKQVVTVMPDGSGKIELRYGLSARMVQLAVESEEDPFKEVAPERIAKKSEGIAAWTRPERSKEDGFSYLTYTAYFKDINRVRLAGLGEGKPAQYRYTRRGESAALTMTHGTILSMVGEYKPTPEAEREEQRKELAGMAFDEHFVLPGTIKPVEGVAVKDNTARLSMTVDDLLAGTGPFESLKGQRKLMFEVPRVSVEASAIASFKQEMADAVAAWETAQREAD